MVLANAQSFFFNGLCHWRKETIRQKKKFNQSQFIMLLNTISYSDFIQSYIVNILMNIFVTT